ncbi:C39 family peptidase [Exiguobacterium sp. PFWT01]|uniref:C39 family peptidase n=1 Tax=Exiguobacterium sp. PFWT01 TaxID=2829816 RepID=UPI001BAAE3E5|nr:C39 family peptidase [Exiguobacterium sp. PFWT01]QUP87822.1 C39 family peptidase [Exiguobacterium sp. PFWT01]
MTWKRRVGIGLLIGAVWTSPQFASAEGSFQQTEDGIVYTSSDGTVLTGWQVIEGHTYYLNEDGTLLTGWQEIEGATYYFETDGRLITGAYAIDGTTYTFDENGKLLTGWQERDGLVYYYDETGQPVTGFQTIAGKRYYFNEDGVRLSGWQQIEGKSHYFFSDGTIRTGIHTINQKTYYLMNEGKVATGWHTIDSRSYYFGNDGARRQGMIRIGSEVYGFHPTNGHRLTGIYSFHSRYYMFDSKGKRQYGLQRVDGKTFGFHPTLGYRLNGKFKIGTKTYFFHSSGERVTGWKYTTQYEYFAPTLIKKTDWQLIKGKWYYFDTNGKMFQNRRVGNASFDARGVYSQALSIYKMSVPLYRQFPMGYPSGCEFFSLKMALEEKGRAVSASTLYNEMPKSMWNARYENRLYRWVDPNVMFTGDPKGTLGKYKNYGIYPKGMIGFASKYRPVKDLSNQGLGSIERELSMGNPVIVWASVDFNKPYGYFNWYTASNKKFTGYVNYHVMLATGYDKSNLYINDPYRGRLVIPKSKVSAVMSATGWKALAVR